MQSVNAPLLYEVFVVFVCVCVCVCVCDVNGVSLVACF